MTGRGPFVILGGGPCGLAAAWHLARAGKKPIVIEATPHVGGLCATHERDGYRFDLGGHRFVSSDGALTRWLTDLLGDDLLTQERKSVVLHDGRTFAYPLDARDLLKNLGVRENAQALLGYAGARARSAMRPRTDRTFEEWVTARFGRPLYDTFFGPYTEKLWGISPRQISADWAAERISLLSLGDAALRLAGARRSPIRTYARRYLYPRYGMGQLYEAIACDIKKHGGIIRTSTKVVGLEVVGTRVVAVRVESAPSGGADHEGRGPERIAAAELLSTIPLPDLAQKLRPDLPAELAQSARALKFRALTFVNLILERPEFSPYTWMYVASSRATMSRIQEPKRRSIAMSPPGRTSLMLEVPCNVGDESWTSPVGAMRARMTSELAALSLPVPDVTDAFCVRVAHGYPVYHVGYERDRQALLSFVAGFDNVRTAGRQGLFRYIFMDAAMQMGALAAEQMLRGSRDVRALDAMGHTARVTETQALTA